MLKHGGGFVKMCINKGSVLGSTIRSCTMTMLLLKKAPCAKKFEQKVHCWTPEQPPFTPLFTRFWLPLTTGCFQNEHLLCRTHISRYWKCTEKYVPIQRCFSGYQVLICQGSNQIFVLI